MSLDITEELKKRGAQIQNVTSTYISCNAYYRGGDNPTALCVFLDNLTCYDFVTKRKFSLEELLGMKIDKTKLVTKLGRVHTPTYFKKEDKLLLLPQYDYFKERGISEDTLKCFENGMCHSGELYQRSSFPIYEWPQYGKPKIIGYHGRKVDDNRAGAKWKIIGKKQYFVYPAFRSEPYIEQTQSVVLVEGGDFLFLWDAGVRQVLACLGGNLNPAMIKYMLRFQDLNIYLGFNSDEAGRKSFEKAHKKLSQFFPNEQLHDAAPAGHGDFGEMTKAQISDWAATCKLTIHK